MRSGFLLCLVDGNGSLFREMLEERHRVAQIAEEPLAPFTAVSDSGRASKADRSHLDREKSSRTTTRRSFILPAFGAKVYAGTIQPLT